MIAGTLLEKIEFQQPIKVKSEYGSENIEYVTVITTRASIKFQNMSRIEQNQEIFMPNMIIFTVRRYHKFSNDFIISWNGKKYRITSINQEKHRQQIEIIGELINE